MSESYKQQFVKIFWECVSAGMSTVDARHYASLELQPINKNATGNSK